MWPGSILICWCRGLVELVKRELNLKAYFLELQSNGSSIVTGRRDGWTEVFDVLPYRIISWRIKKPFSRTENIPRTCPLAIIFNFWPNEFHPFFDAHTIFGWTQFLLFILRRLDLIGSMDVWHWYRYDLHYFLALSLSLCVSFDFSMNFMRCQGTRVSFNKIFCDSHSNCFFVVVAVSWVRVSFSLPHSAHLSAHTNRIQFALAQ